MIDSLEADPISSGKMICLEVADLRLWLVECDHSHSLSIPPIHRRFLRSREQLCAGDLVLEVRKSAPDPVLSHHRPVRRYRMWELWQDEAGRYLFSAPGRQPERWLRIEPDFTSGEAWGNYPAASGPGDYPLGELEIILYANWLAGNGDAILHGAGIEVDGQGYCFLGEPGAGKSTLAAALVRYPGVRVLGEDQVILRRREGGFRIYGTPWHLNPDLCSPGGAPLRKIFILDRFAEKRIEGLRGAEGLARIVQNAFVPSYRREALAGILDGLTELCVEVPVWKLAYRLGSDVLRIVLAA